MTDEIYCTDDDNEIVDFLTDQGIKLNDESDRCLAFFLDGNFYVVLYFSAKNDRGFIMFRLNDIVKNAQHLSTLKTTLLELHQVQLKNSLIPKAISIIETIEIAGSFKSMMK